MNAMMSNGLRIAAALATMSLVACGQAPDAGSTSSSAADTVGADPSGWCHDTVRSTDATNLSFDYQVNMSRDTGTGETAWTSRTGNAWLNVQNWNFTGSEEVNVTVLSYESYGPAVGNFTLDGTYVTHLTWDGANHKFTAPVGADVFLYHYVEGDDVAAEATIQFAIEVDGKWLTDPIAGGHNFGFIPSRQQQGTCSGDDIPVN